MAGPLNIHGVDRPQHQEGWQGGARWTTRLINPALPSHSPSTLNQNDGVNGKISTVGKSDETGIADWTVTTPLGRPAVLNSLRNLSISNLARQNC